MRSPHTPVQPKQQQGDLVKRFKFTPMPSGNADMPQIHIPVHKKTEPSEGQH